MSLHARASRLLVGFVLAIAFYGCRSSTSEGAHQISLAEHRAVKDSLFKSDQSPLSDSLKAVFEGLTYYPMDSSLIIRLKLALYDDPRRVQMLTSKGLTKSYSEAGYFQWGAENTLKLNVYKADPPIPGHETLLFIPFKDLTNGSETYSAGRYIELESNDSGIYLLDFNRAYNPWCVYSKNYNCPYPPVENHLPVSIRAGEKMPVYHDSI